VKHVCLDKLDKLYSQGSKESNVRTFSKLLDFLIISNSEKHMKSLEIRNIPQEITNLSENNKTAEKELLALPEAIFS
jgi:hypothetical protein